MAMRARAAWPAWTSRVGSGGSAPAVGRGDVSPRAAALALGGLVGFAVLAYGIGSGATKDIWNVPDELVYGSLARSLAASGHFSLQGVHTLTFPAGYPILIAPAFLAHDPITQYDLAKWLNAVLMCLTAIPVYLLSLAGSLRPRFPARGRAHAPHPLDGLCPRPHGRERLLPTLHAHALLLVVRTLERPTVVRQVLALAVVVPLTAVRSEGLLLVPVIVCGIALVSLTSATRSRGAYLKDALGELWRFRFTLLILPLGLAALLLAEEGNRQVAESGARPLRRHVKGLPVRPDAALEPLPACRPRDLPRGDSARPGATRRRRAARALRGTAPRARTCRRRGSRGDPLHSRGRCHLAGRAGGVGVPHTTTSRCRRTCTTVTASTSLRCS